jgi:hypothetical protein
VETAFGGPAGRDAFEFVTRAVTGGRYRVDNALARPERGRALERFVFGLSYRESGVTLVLRDGFVTDEFIDLTGTHERTESQKRRLDLLKGEMAERVLARPAGELYEISDPTRDDPGGQRGARGRDDGAGPGAPGWSRRSLVRIPSLTFSSCRGLAGSLRAESSPPRSGGHDDAANRAIARVGAGVVADEEEQVEVERAARAAVDALSRDPHVAVGGGRTASR